MRDSLESTTRLHVEIPEDLDAKCFASMPYGMKSSTVRALLEIFLEAKERIGNVPCHYHLLENNLRLEIITTKGKIDDSDTS